MINSFLALRTSQRPILCHQRRIASTAKRAVSWSMPTLTQP